MKLEIFEPCFSKINKYLAKKCQTLVVSKCITKKKKCIEVLKVNNCEYSHIGWNW
jgi:hypothetical protein